MYREELQLPINFTDKYFYDIAVSLRIIVDMLSGVASVQTEHAVEDVEIRYEDWGYRIAEAEKTLETKSVVELKALAKQSGLTGYSDMRKEELIDAIIHDSDYDI